jgi:hypothetical protein
VLENFNSRYNDPTPEKLQVRLVELLEGFSRIVASSVSLTSTVAAAALRAAGAPVE